ncbi:uncharacterized protein TRIADDRAFT_60387 [Trichoplax adhaerens]|uniref:Lipoxygenase domain-containing protein n=1 Tax=Trichoplax adhaerens TaxID=10228 RepID=B3S831_TRIAD|nr:hypothetical protein TRIADDRAFT_60387 [Trichoplax adhaerens]EDV21123.1 hypothetical protein TRIADDRAFT_60387 [Trichoplax adhaerens]|eukprot:XP_002116453.1 hypothetical protein TRIADDRAFT_60387 [Trichoplax adhaerens]
MPSDLIIDNFSDDKVFAEQRLAGLHPLQLSRVFKSSCPQGWKLIGKHCYKAFRPYHYTNWHIAQYKCKCNHGRLPILSDPTEAKLVNKYFKAWYSRVYVGAKYGKWLDGTTVENTYNTPSYFRKCLSARFSRYGLRLFYTSCFKPVWKVVCQRDAIFDGTKVSELKPFLNPDFGWKNAIESKLNSQTFGNTVNQALEDGRIFVMQFPELRALPQGPDINEVPTDNRTMQNTSSPIAIFVSNPDVNNGQLLPVAIQMDSTPTSSVFTPADGDNWSIAKTRAQLATYVSSQLVEHLLKTQFLMDPVCVVGNRHLPLKHPLRQILRRHCVGTLYGIDKSATETILPYYPYRDDGKKVFDLLRDFTEQYISLYYDSDADVVNDFELQAWADELSNEATGTPNSANGKIKDFPPAFQNRRQLINAIHLILWTASGQHAAVNYPLLEYASFVPNMPGKYYDVDGVAGFQPERFPTGSQSITQVNFANLQTTLRHDSLLDYGADIEDPPAQALVTSFAAQSSTLEASLIATNLQNVADGHLNYAYLFPSLITNSNSV